MADLLKSEIEGIIKEVRYPKYQFAVLEDPKGRHWIQGYRSDYDPNTGNTKKYESCKWLVWAGATPYHILQIIFALVKYEEDIEIKNRFLFRGEAVFAEKT